MTEVVTPEEPSIDKILSLLPKEAVALLGECSETLQHVVLATTGSIYRDCEEQGVILDPIQNEVFINAFVRAATANAAFFMQAIDRSNQVIQAMTEAYQNLYNQVLDMQQPEPETVPTPQRGLFRRPKR